MKGSKCGICRTKDSDIWMHQGDYTTCKLCSNDIRIYEFQPRKEFNLKMLLEVFFRRGKGEKINYKEIHEKKGNLKLVEFMDLFDPVHNSEKKNE